MHGFKRLVSGVERATAAATNAREAFQVAVQFERRDDLPAAEAGYRHADKLGHPEAALRLGVLLQEQDDLDGAEEAYRRADTRGDSTGSFHLGWLLAERGDVPGAQAAYERAEQAGFPGAAGNLRVLLAGHRSAPSAGALLTRIGTPDLQTPPAATIKPATRFKHAGRARAGKPRALRTLASAALILVFAASFALGSAGHRPAARSVHAAPAAQVSRPTVTIASLKPVATPSVLRDTHKRRHTPPHRKLRRRPRHEIKPVAATVTTVQTTPTVPTPTTSSVATQTTTYSAPTPAPSYSAPAYSAPAPTPQPSRSDPRSPPRSGSASGSGSHSGTGGTGTVSGGG